MVFNFTSDNSQIRVNGVRVDLVTPGNNKRRFPVNRWYLSRVFHYVTDKSLPFSRQSSLFMDPSFHHFCCQPRPGTVSICVQTTCITPHLSFSNHPVLHNAPTENGRCEVLFTLLFSLGRGGKKGAIRRRKGRKNLHPS